MPNPESIYDPIRRGEIWIEDRTGGLVTFAPYPWQQENNARWAKNRADGKFTYEIWLKGRQPGATTDAICGNVADAKTRRVKSLIVATTDDMIDVVFDKAKIACFGDALDDLPEEDEEDEDEDGRPARKRAKRQVARKKFTVPGTGSVIRIRNERGIQRRGAQKKVARGGTFQTALFTEIDLWKDFDQTYDALIPAIAHADPYGRLVMESTLEPGGSTAYRKFVNDALQRKGRFHVAFTAWWKVPEYSLALSRARTQEIERSLDSKESWFLNQGASIGNVAWRREQIGIMGGEDRFARIHPSTAEECLAAADGALFDGDTHSWLEDGIRPPIKRRWAGPLDNSAQLLDFLPAERHKDDPWAEIFMVPEPGVPYFMGIDSADSSQTANKGSSSCNAIVIINGMTGDEVCEWTGFTEPHVCAAAATALGRHYNNAKAVIEVDASGKAVLALMRQLYKYDHWYMREVVDRTSGRPTEQIGFQSLKQTNARLMSIFVQLVTDRKVKNYGERLTKQVIGLSRRGGEWSMQDNNPGEVKELDDLARAWALAMVGCERRDAWSPQYVRLKHESHIIVDRRNGVTWADIDRMREEQAVDTYPGLISV